MCVRVYVSVYVYVCVCVCVCVCCVSVRLTFCFVLPTGVHVPRVHSLVERANGKAIRVSGRISLPAISRKPGARIRVLRFHRRRYRHSPPGSC